MAPQRVKSNTQHEWIKMLALFSPVAADTGLNSSERGNYVPIKKEDHGPTQSPENNHLQSSKSADTKPKFFRLFSAKQLEVLHREFNNNPYPSVCRRRDIAKAFKLSEKSILNWFVNRRCQLRKNAARDLMRKVNRRHNKAPNPKEVLAIKSETGILSAKREKVKKLADQPDANATVTPFKPWRPWVSS